MQTYIVLHIYLLMILATGNISMLYLYDLAKLAVYLYKLSIGFFGDKGFMRLLYYDGVNLSNSHKLFYKLYIKNTTCTYIKKC